MKKAIYILILPVFLFSCNLNTPPQNNLPGKLDSIKIGRDTIPHIQAKTPEEKADSVFSDFKCMGNEPFWQTYLDKEKNNIDFYLPLEQKTIHFDYSPPTIKEGTILFSITDNALKNKIRISIKKESCGDGMSEKKYSYSSEVILNDKKYTGCAQVTYILKHSGEPLLNAK